MIALRQPRLDELPVLSALCLQSKAYWGYDAAFLEACKAELTLTPRHLEETYLRVADQDDQVLGVVHIELELHGDKKVASLENLFVKPDTIGSGVGKILYDWALEKAADLNADYLEIISDPNAEPFYRKMGAVRVGETPSASIPGRRLPKLWHSIAK